MLVALFINPARIMSSSHRLVDFLILPLVPGTCVVTLALMPLVKSPFPVVSTIADNGYVIDYY